jgi:hypothetical protein
MAIGDTWETINTYAFVAGETIITADYENDVVNNLEYLYTHPSSGVNIYTGNTNTQVTLNATTNDILAGLTLTFTPTQDKVLLLIYYMANSGWVSTSEVDVAYKVGTGAITYISQTTNRTTGADTYGVVFATPTVTAGSSNTITMYAKNTGAVSKILYAMRVFAIEMAN